jgi:putative endonuclease
MFYTYVLVSEMNGDLYIGYTSDLKKRFEEHHLGKVFSTASKRPLKLVYYEACIDEKDAIAREKSLKTGYGRKYIKRRISNYLSLLGAGNAGRHQ